MKTVFGAALALMMIVGSAVSSLAATITATITHIDVKARIIVVDSRAFHLGTTINIGAFKVGEKVTVVYERNNGQLRIVTIKAA
ncbi:MAG: hypothetical protein AAGD34_05175 [Pseudomonadota bacterium]